MKSSSCRVAGVLLVLLTILPGAAAQAPLPGKAWIIPIQGDIEPSMTAFVRREVRKAQNDGAEYIVFEIDTFGGRVDSALQITSAIMSVKKARTIAWVNNGEASMGVSWSAGALIAFSCNDIYMAPGTSMGAAAPVTAGPGGVMDAAGEKTVSAVRSQMAALAERNGHPVGIALAMVDLDVELWEARENGETRVLTLGDLEALEAGEADGEGVERVRVISPPGKLLSLTAGEANRYGLAAGLAETREALLEAIGAGGYLGESVPGAADMLISFLTSGPVQVILILLGLVMVFLEIHTPGFGIPGVTAIVSFLVVFGSGMMLGRVGSLEIVLFLAGLVLLAVELFVIPGFGVVGISGFLLIGLSLVFSMQDFVIPRFDWEWTLMGRNVAVVIISLILSVAGIAVIALLGPKTKIFDRFTLTSQITGTAGGRFEDEEDYAALTGKIGTADSVLRPSGKAVFDGKVYSVEADGAFIESGKGIIVTHVRGNRIIVKRV
ncbi:MAG: nodulation protein NfeD [Treponema sp.]|jgi:membrane-bound serine protease (ClpP class)|nr:nodulation protein NfeD [Treponema sp.]